MDELKGNKIERVLGIYTKLMEGDIVNKSEEAKNYGVNERSIQRDIDDIRNFLECDAERVGYINNVEYDRAAKGYRLEQIYRLKFTNQEILAICKILLDSRAFTKDEMTELIEKLIAGCVPKENQKLVKGMVDNELFHYVEPRHKKKFLDTLWKIAQAIRNCNVIEIGYARLKDKKTVKRRVRPVGIMFSEYYFYLTAFIEDDEIREHFDVINDSSPTIYRIDRIKSVEISDERFKVPYSSRFEEGEFRKRVQFMYGGKLRKVKFKYSGLSVEAVLDRLPTAKILSEEDGVYTISAEVFGDGIDMWLKGQGENVEILNGAT